MTLPPQPEIVVAVVDRGDLSTLLTSLHRYGFGHVTRVLDPERAEVGDQLRRAGVEVPSQMGKVAGNRLCVMVSAPARTRVAMDLLLRSGAAVAWEVERINMPQPVLLGSLNKRPRQRPVNAAEEQTAD